MKLLIADDHTLVRDGLKHTLSEMQKSISFVEAENGQQVKEALNTHNNVDLVLLDLFMPDIDGFTLISYVCNNHPSIPVVVISASNDPHHMRKVLDLGASGFIPKSTIRDVMLTALKLVISGGVYIPPDMLANPTPQPVEPNTTQNADDENIKAKLTSRQVDVLQLLAQGDQNKHIAEKLNISEHTIKIHITAIFKALKVTNRTQAVLVAQKILGN